VFSTLERMLLFNEVLNGWRKTGAIFFVLIWILTLILFILFLVSFYPISSFADTTLFQGSCTQSSRNVLIMSLFVNVVSTTVLTPSSFFLQILMAPTRADIDKAHRRAQWFDVGIPSFRNLRLLSWSKSALWLFIAITSLPLHLLFNIAVCDNNANTEFITALAKEGLLEGSNYALPGVGWEYFGELQFEIENDSETFSQKIDYITRSAAMYKSFPPPTKI